MKIIFAILLLALAGCGSNDPNAKRVSDSGGAADVKLIELEDGTKCAVLIGYQKGALSCDWEGNRK